ncbi:DUF3043 domain-containing protein [Salinispora sp. H7-4]|uniref:DUF3043 domain-containing protein n=1 Tax=Salinispora sp. H7-4 TaxID=2748321 RepID=UPI0015D2EE81|nr:DUF3043 domain-containing protein [Salinispora sp. H7-4]NYT94498.1 DUF3043 domain-containing protein [Salinispora sp. H7-4]
MPLFRRKATDLLDESTTPVTPEEEPAAQPRGYTPAKGRETPKRPSVGRRPTTVVKSLSKEERRAERRRLRAESAAEFRREGGPRDRGPERLLVRNVVDSRRTVGTWFFGGALIVLLGSNQAMPPEVRLGSNILWVMIAIALIIDSILISRKIKKLVRERFPNTGQRLGSLYLYAIMRSITFRRMRAPAPRVAIGDPV